MELRAMAATLSPLPTPRDRRALARRLTLSWSWAKVRRSPSQAMARGDGGGQGLGAAGGGDVPEAHLRQPQARVLAGDADIAAHGQLDAGAQGVAVDSGDKGLLQGEHEPPQIALTAGAPRGEGGGGRAPPPR